MRRYKITHRRHLRCKGKWIVTEVVSLETSREITSTRAQEEVVQKAERSLGMPWSFEMLEIDTELFRVMEKQIAGELFNDK